MAIDDDGPQPPPEPTSRSDRLRARREELRSLYARSRLVIFWSALVGVIIALEMAAVLLHGFSLTSAPATDATALRLGNTKVLGIEVYTHYLYPLQIAAVLLLVAIIAAIALTLRARKDTKHVDPSLQVRVTKAERLRIVKLAPERDAVRPTDTDVAPVGDRR